MSSLAVSVAIEPTLNLTRSLVFSSRSLCRGQGPRCRRNRRQPDRSVLQGCRYVSSTSPSTGPDLEKLTPHPTPLPRTDLKQKADKTADELKDVADDNMSTLSQTAGKAKAALGGAAETASNLAGSTSLPPSPPFLPQKPIADDFLAPLGLQRSDWVTLRSTAGRSFRPNLSRTPTRARRSTRLSRPRARTSRRPASRLATRATS